MFDAQRLAQVETSDEALSANKKKPTRRRQQQQERGTSSERAELRSWAARQATGRDLGYDLNLPTVSGLKMDDGLGVCSYRGNPA